ncbi:MAG: branched-chain amino acid ABC transporter permease [Chloroflexi bacterium]|nr:branched-chain amino acid ABC transporter permease [Chloroflexota bacterium]
MRTNPVLFAQFVVDGIRLGFVYGLIALGYTMVYGIVRLINFAHGDVFMVGAYTAFYATTRFRWGFIPAMGLAMGVCAFLAVIIERVAYKPLREAPRIAALITAIGVSFFLEYFTALDFVFTPNFINYTPLPIRFQTWDVGGVTFSNVMLIVIGVSLLCLAVLWYLVYRTKLGKAMRAVAWDKPTARLMGIDVDLVITFTFAVGAALAGLGGMLYVILYPQIRTFLGVMPGLKAFIAAVFGGIGSLPGAFIGSLIIGMIETLSQGYLSSTLRDFIVFSVLIIVLLFKPTGLFGESAKEKA